MKDIDAWRESQTTSLISNLVTNITCTEPNFNSLAHSVGLDPLVQQWVKTIQPCLREAAICMINQETIEDILIPHATELLETDWMRHQTEIQSKIHKKSEAYNAQLRSEVETYFETHRKSLQDATDKCLQELELELDSKLSDEIVKLKNKTKTTLLAAKEEADMHSLSLAIWTPKMAKPSPLNIKKPKKTKKKKLTVLDLTTPSPDNDADQNPEMETNTNSTPTTLVCRPSTPSPNPVILDLTELTPPPAWAHTASPDDRTPCAPSFPPPTPTAPTPLTPAITLVNPELAAIMATISGMHTDLLDRIKKVNARVDQVTGPQTIPDYMAWNEENPAHNSFSYHHHP